MKNLKTNPSGNIAKLAKYSHKVLKMPFRPEELNTPLKNKTYAPDLAILAAMVSLMTGANSAAQMSTLMRDISEKQGRGSSLSRSTIGTLLNEPRTLDWLNERLLGFLEIAKSMRVFKVDGIGNNIAAVVDGIDLGEVHKDGGKCKLCIERKHKNGNVHHFHKLVVLSLLSAVGPIPIYFRFVKPEELATDHEEMSEQKFKTECELSCTKKLLTELAQKFGGKLPFDILASDSLFANAPFMEHLEALDCSGVFVYKQENRILHRQAKADFCGKSLALGVGEQSWVYQNRAFSSKWAVYSDKNRKKDNKNVRIFETKRTEADGTLITSMAITSDDPIITPKLVEAVRFGKWNSLENGVFNELTNNWGTLKHLFFHHTVAIQSMIALQLICLVVSLFYRYRNLNRGGRKHRSTLKAFLSKMLSDLYSMTKEQVIELVCNSPPCIS